MIIKIRATRCRLGEVEIEKQLLTIALMCSSEGWRWGERFRYPGQNPYKLSSK